MSIHIINIYILTLWDVYTVNPTWTLENGLNPKIYKNSSELY